MTITYEFLNEAMQVMKTKTETKPDDEFDKELNYYNWEIEHYGGKIEREYENGKFKEITLLICMISPKDLSHYMRVKLKR